MTNLPTEVEVEDVLMDAFDWAYYGILGDPDHVPYSADDTITLASIARQALEEAGYLVLAEGGV